jgi:AcrR family transcriptional regulator
MSTLRTAGLREQNKREKRERLRNAASELFESVGFEETTTRAIAERAGVAAGTLFLYAEGKQDLLFLVFHDDAEAALAEGIATLPKSRPLVTQLMHLFRAVFGVYGRHPRAAGPFLGALPASRGRNAIAMNTLTMTFIVKMADLVEAAKTRGEVDAEIEPLLAAQNFFALYFFALTTWVSGLSTLEDALDPTLRQAVLLQLRGLMPTPKPRNAGHKEKRR